MGKRLRRIIVLSNVPWFPLKLALECNTHWNKISSTLLQQIYYLYCKGKEDFLLGCTWYSPYSTASKLKL